AFPPRLRRPRSRSLGLGLALATLAVLAPALWLVVREAPRRRTAAEPDLREIGRLATAGRFDQATERVEALLRADSNNGLLRVIAAQPALDRPDPPPERALAHLGRFRSADPVLTARAKLAEGKAAYALSHCEQAEACWLEALRLDPRVPEAAWTLLDLYYLEGRSEEARRL